jgi:hypothetical protein
MAMAHVVLSACCADSLRSFEIVDIFSQNTVLAERIKVRLMFLVFVATNIIKYELKLFVGL